MNGGDFYNDPLDEGGMAQDFSYAVEMYKKACDEGTEYSLVLSEEEFNYVIDYFINKEDEENVLKASGIAFAQHSYSSELLIKYVDSLLLSGDVERAVEMLDEYKGSFSQNADIELLYCRAAICRENYEQAREYFSNFVSFDRDEAASAEAAASLAQDCIDKGNYGEGVYYLLKSNDIAPLSYEYYNDLAFCYERLDDLAKSVEFYNKYLDKDPFNDNVWFNLGTVYAREGKFEEAIEAFEYSIALNENNSSSLYNLAIVYLNMERYKDSAEFFTKFNNCEENSLAGYLGLANACMGAHDFASARLAFRKAADIDPQCSEVRIGLEAVLAMEDYLEGMRNNFLLRIDNIVRTDVTWINTMRKLLPQLNEDMEFIKYLKSIKKSK